MSITIELPLSLETVLTTKADIQGLSVPDLLVQLARREAESGYYSSEDIQGFLEADALPAELSAKVQGLLGK